MSGARTSLVVLGVIAGFVAMAAAGAPDTANSQQATDSVGGLLGALGNSLGAAQRHDAVDFHTLVALLPASLKGMQRGTPRGSANQAMGIKATSAEVDFQGANAARINVSIKDATAFSAIAGLAEMANATEFEQGDDYEKNATVGGRNVHERWSASDRHGELSLILAQRFGVDITGYGVGMDALESTLAGIDLDKLESMKDANPRQQ